MIVIVAVDDRGGMMFGSRRQSQDRVLRQRVLSLAEGRTVWMNAYTAKQFGDQDNDQRDRCAFYYFLHSS
ncbi:MAG: ribonuclease Z, partial [Lachnospiraceae bacterium]|nr:ribonuclease Z [Lachnospiraceae bacterium]